MSTHVTLEGARCRETDGLVVSLLWSGVADRVKVVVADTRLRTRFELAVAPDRALDAFNHPFLYAAARRSRRAPAPRKGGGRLIRIPPDPIPRRRGRAVSSSDVPPPGRPSPGRHTSTTPHDTTHTPHQSIQGEIDHVSQ